MTAQRLPLPLSLRLEKSTPPLRSSIAGLIAFALSSSSLLAAPELLSVGLGSGPQGSSGNGNSVSPVVTPDGRYVVFSSSANNLVVGDNSQMGLDVFLRDRISQTTELVSVSVAGGGGGNGHSTALGVSTNGRYVLFQSEASDLIAGDTNGVSDVFVRDRQLGTTLLVSVGAGGVWGNGASTEAVMTPDGRWVAFVSAATNLVSGDTNGVMDLFWRDLVGGITQWITVGGTGVNTYASSPVITPDGRYTAFFSTARGLAAGVPTTTRGEIYRFDALTSSLTWVSTNAAVTTSNLLGLNNPPSFHPAISDDGRYVAFKCGWTNGPIAPAPQVGAALVFRYDAATGSSDLVSTNSYPPWFQNDDVFGPAMTPNGRYIAYAEQEIGGGITNCSVRLWDAQTGTNVQVSSGPDGLWQTNSTSHTPTVSADGRYVTFLSDATNLVGNAVSNGFHLYRRDLQSGTTVLVDANADGIGSIDQTGVLPQTSPDGHFVVYAAEDGLIASDTNQMLDVVLWDANAGTNELVSVRNPAATSASGSGLSVLGPLSVSGDGQWIAFVSYAPDLVTNDFNCEGDVFVRDRWTGVAVLVSVGLDGNTAIGGTSHSPVMSGDGRYVFFLSAATNLVAGDTNQATDLFRRDLWAGTTVRASVNSLGSALGTGDSLSLASSPDGRYVTFLCRTNTASTSGAIFWRDLQVGQTLLVGAVSSAIRPPSISANGQRVAYSELVPNLRVWDAGTQLSTNLANLSLQGLRSFSIAPSGDKVLYENGSQLFVRNLAYSTNEVLCTLPQPIKGSPWSGDGRFAAFVTRTNLLPNDANGTNDVYLRDFQTGSFILVSRRNQFVLASGNGSSDWPSLSADGRYVAFRSVATNITSEVGRPPSLLVFDRVTGTNSLVVLSTTGMGSMAWLAQPSLGAAGSLLAFHGWDEGLVAEDRNRFGDTFASGLAFAPVDSDGDGIPDWWTLQYFGHTTGQAGDLSRAGEDVDGDGLTNLEEFLAGTVPTSASSSLALNIAAGSAGSEVMLNWEAAPGRNYQVFSTTNLTSPIWEIVPGSIGVLGRQASFVTSLAAAQRYFRVECEIE